jgi:hypothetical protein
MLRLRFPPHPPQQYAIIEGIEEEIPQDTVSGLLSLLGLHNTKQLHPVAGTFH